MQTFDALVPIAFVRDVNTSIAFYRRIGFEVQNTFTPPDTNEPAWAWLKSGGASLRRGGRGAGGVFLH